jgi:hypothetical protein
LPRRVRVVESTPLAQTKAVRFAAAQPAAHARLSGRPPQGQHRTGAGEAEAQPAARLGVRALRWPAHQLTSTVAAEWVPAKRPPRGRPPTHAPRPQRQRWRGTGHVQEAPTAIARRAQRERRLVLARHGRDAPPRAAAEWRRADTGQPAAELRCKWAKHPAAIAPLFLDTPTCMAALGGVSVLARLVYTLVERHARSSLADRGDTQPDRPAPRQRPTARTVFQRMRTMAVVTLVWGGPRHRQVPALSPVPRQVIDLLGYEDSSSALPDRHAR